MVVRKDPTDEASCAVVKKGGPPSAASTSTRVTASIMFASGHQNLVGCAIKALLGAPRLADEADGPLALAAAARALAPRSSSSAMALWRGWLSAQRLASLSA